jgi:hypothetical protein
LDIAEVEEMSARAVGAPIEGEEATMSWLGAENNCACAVAKENADIAVAPIDNRGEALGAYEEDILGGSGAEKLFSENQSVDKAGAGGL